MNLRKMFLLLDKHNVTYLQDNCFLPHWICPDKKEAKSLIRQIFRCLDHKELTHNNFFLQRKKKICQYEDCVNPDCYEIRINPKLSEDSMNLEDLKELAEVINLEDYYTLGETEYLKVFNEDQPEFLKITKKQLEIVVNYIRSTQND